jgi:DNA-binding NarL/FixJ family response regulator
MTHSKPEPRAKVLIVDDHPPIREALAFRIGRQSDLEVCGEAADVDDALRLVESTKPDVAIVDISLKSGSGFDLIKRIKDRDDRVRMLVWSSHSESLYAERAIKVGALGFINKDQETEKIIEAIRRVLEGKIYLSEAMTEMMLRRAVGGARSGRSGTPLEMLANRELEVLRLIGQGLKTAEIAGRMNVGIKTVETYRERIREKLNLSNGAELAHYATKWMLENG